ncbi:MAG: carboxypeptidase-like regulatory domain-containing protein, partial [Bryobacteraceae bacterium]
MSRLNVAAWTIGVSLIFYCPRQILAQAVANALIHGVVRDASGAVVPAAQVRATQTDTGRVLSTVSATDGSYVLANLPVGPYKFEVSAPGFSNYAQSGITL